MAERTQKTTADPKAGLPERDIKARILAEAIRLFGSQGYDATSIQAVAQGVGIRKQSLLYHFESKERLRHAVIDAWMAYWRVELPRMVAPQDGYDRFSGSVAALLSFFQEDPNRARLVLRELLDRPEELRAQVREDLRPWIQVLSDYIRMGQASGIIRAEVRAESYLIQVLTLIVSSVIGVFPPRMLALIM